MNETLALLVRNLDVTIRNHSAVQLVLTLERPYKAVLDQVPVSPQFGFVVDANVPHDCFSSNSVVLVISVEALSRRGRWMKANLIGPKRFRLLDELLGSGAVSSAFETLRSASEPSLCLCEDFLRALGTPEAAGVGLDPRLVIAVDQLNDRLLDPPRLTALAASLALSERRLREIFSREIGVSYRRFLLWTRIRRSLNALAAGASLGSVAAESGFVDQAHFSKTCRQMFGVSPSRLNANVHFLV